ncbi:PDR/VanB family oxidoreductase [Ideonella livida]|uniref:Oxidoreductase n=1 Tax=Ideonella livida TaxID=2707176 RepID=A0A7C9TLD2_9BURK|nr:PDR/VanB family oxidoreductase [Ideonella livida]NDY93440.1 oxidoreductase [Ideonella livida]
MTLTLASAEASRPAPSPAPILAATVAPQGAWPQLPAGTRWLQVQRRERLCADIVALTLVDPSGVPLPDWTAGAHVDLLLPLDGPAAPPRARSYSLCHRPGERGHYQIAVQRERAGRGGSAWVHEHLHEGAWVPVRPPRNLFTLRPAPHVLLLAGGIGLTPLLAMAEALWAEGRSFALQVAVRQRTRLPFAARLAQAPWARHVQVWADDEGAALDLPAQLAAQPAGTLVATCGPAGFMAAVQRAAQQAGWAPERVLLEHFAAPPAAAVDRPATVSAVAPEAAPDFAPDAAPAQVLWAPTGQCLALPPQASVAQVLRAAGVALDLSCEQGICGQCCLQVLDGQAEHRDLVYGPHEHTVERRFTPCCSRPAAGAAGPLVLAPLGWAQAEGSA